MFGSNIILSVENHNINTTDNNTDYVIIQIGENKNSGGYKQIRVAIEDVNQIKQSVTKLQTKVENNLISEDEYLKNIISIFHEYELLPVSFTYENLVKIAEILNQNLLEKDTTNLIFRNILFKNTINTTKNNEINANKNEVPIHIGAVTMYSVVFYGGTWGFAFPINKNFIEPYIEDIFNTSLKDSIEILSYMTINPNIFIWIPGTTGFYCLNSMASIPGLSEYKNVIWTEKAVFGIVLLSMGLNLFCYTDERPERIIFTASIGIFGEDILLSI